MEKIIKYILILFLLASCQKDEDLVNKFELKVYGEGYEWVGYMDGNEWHGGHYRGAAVFKFDVPKGDTMGIYNSGTHTILIMNGEVYLDLYHEDFLYKKFLFQ